jgi:chemotaxis protein MotB
MEGSEMIGREGRPVTSPPSHRPSAWLACIIGTAVVFGACVMKSTYNKMLVQQQSIETALRSEVAADQVQIEQLKDGIRVNMSGALLYREGAVELSPAGIAALNKVAPQFAAETYEIDVVGNTDNLPIARAFEARFPTNWELAGERAAIVVRHLQSRGVDPTRMRAISAGEYHPRGSNDTAEGRARNRRTGILLRPR